MEELKSKNKGFSLAEVILTVCILSVGLVVILQALSFSSRVTGLACDVIRVVLLAEDKMQEFEFHEKNGDISARKETGTQDELSWEYSIEPVGTDDKLYRLDFDVWWTSIGKRQDMRLNTYLKNIQSP